MQGDMNVGLKHLNPIFRIKEIASLLKLGGSWNLYIEYAVRRSPLTLFVS